MLDKFIKDRRGSGGWLTWIWPKVAVLIVALMGMGMLFMLYDHIEQIKTSDKANQIAQEFRNSVLDVYASQKGIQSQPHILPDRCRGFEYEMYIVNKTGNLTGILINAYKDGSSEVYAKGGSSFAVPLNVTFNGGKYPLHSRNEMEVKVNMTNQGNNVSLRLW